MPAGSPFLACMQRVEDQRKRLAEAAERRRRELKKTQTVNQPAASTTQDGLSSTNTNVSSDLPLTPFVSRAISKIKKEQHVWTIEQRAKIIQWMIENVAREVERNIASKTVHEFPLLFRTSRNAELVRATRFWKSKGDYIDQNGNVKHIGLNPGKEFFFRMVANSVRDDNAMRDNNGLSYARKAMIMCGMALNTNGLWEVSQLKPSLQNIVRKHRAIFDNPDDA